MKKPKPQMNPAFKKYRDRPIPDQKTIEVVRRVKAVMSHPPQRPILVSKTRRWRFTFTLDARKIIELGVKSFQSMEPPTRQARMSVFREFLRASGITDYEVHRDDQDVVFAKQVNSNHLIHVKMEEFHLMPANTKILEKENLFSAGH